MEQNREHTDSWVHIQKFDIAQWHYRLRREIDCSIKEAGIIGHTQGKLDPCHKTKQNDGRKKTLHVKAKL